MKQTFELDPELVAFRTVATLYTREAFRHGVFRTVFSPSSQGELGWLQDYCNRDLTFADGSKPTPNFKVAINQLTAANEIPGSLISSAADEIVGIFNRAGAMIDRDVSKAEETRRAFGERPSLVEKFIINEALSHDARRFLDAHPAAPVPQPVVFRDAFQGMTEPFMHFIANARQVRLRYLQEYVWGYKENGKTAQSLTQYFPPSAHTEVTEWDNQAQMLEAFIGAHGPIPDLSSYERINVTYDHTDDIVGKRRIDAIDSLSVSTQVTRLIVDLQEIKII